MTLVPSGDAERCDEAVADMKRRCAGGKVMVVDYTTPSAVNANAEFYAKHGLDFVMGTTGGDRFVSVCARAPHTRVCAYHPRRLLVSAHGKQPLVLVLLFCWSILPAAAPVFFSQLVLHVSRFPFGFQPALGFSVLPPSERSE